MKFRVEGQQISCIDRTLIVGDTIGMYEAQFTFSDEWNKLGGKIAVFRCAGEEVGTGITIKGSDFACTIPSSIVSRANSGFNLFIGVTSSNVEDEIVTLRYPTAWCNLGAVQFGPTITETTEATAEEASAMETLMANWQDPVSIHDITQTQSSSESLGENEVTITLTNNTSATFTIKNGAQGNPGKDGTSFTIVDTVDTEDDLPTPTKTLRGAAYMVGITTPRNLYTCNGTTWTNQGDLEGPQGIQGETGPQGSKGNPGATGAQGPSGFTWRPSVSTTGDLTWIQSSSTTAPTSTNIKGPKGDPGEDGATGPAGPVGPAGAAGSNGTNGIDGENGVTFTPSVDSEGNLSWTNNGGLTNPTTVNIKGPQGEAGSGADITVDAEMLDTSENPVQNKIVKAYIDAAVGATSSLLGDTSDLSVPNTNSTLGETEDL